jgi:hypothetical protein
LDLDALDDEPAPAQGSKLRKFGTGVTVGEIIELGKKDPATLTPTQKKQLEDANETMRKFAERAAPNLAKVVQASSGIGEMMRKFGEGFRVPEPPSLYGPDFKMPAIIPPASGAEQQKQTLLLQQLVETFEAQTAERDADLHQAIRPSYDANKRALVFANTIIDIPEDTDQEKLCLTLFRAGKPVKKPVELGVALEKMGVPLDRIKGNKKVHSAKQALNDRVEKATQIKELFIIENKKVWVNDRYM